MRRGLAARTRRGSSSLPPRAPRMLVHQRRLSARSRTTWAQQTRRELETNWLGPMKRSPSREPRLTRRQKIFARVGNPTQVGVFQSSGEEGSYVA
jgi:hypothetical protein